VHWLLNIRRAVQTRGDAAVYPKIFLLHGGAHLRRHPVLRADGVERGQVSGQRLVQRVLKGLERLGREFFFRVIGALLKKIALHNARFVIALFVGALRVDRRGAGREKNNAERHQ